MLEIGTGRADITAFYKGVGMMGYGMAHQKVEAIETPLSCRAFVFSDSKSGKKVAFVNAEICFITIAIKRAVINNLKKDCPEGAFDYDNVMLTAQHTHSGPGGYSHYALFNFSIPGFVPEVFNTIVKGITDSIIEAENNLKPGKLKLGSGTFSPEIKVAFNRSMPAYNSNPDVEKLEDDDWHLALDREMDVLQINSEKDEPLGMINWFGVHTTTVGSDLRKICYENKGYASAFFEEELSEKNKDFLAVFAQAPCGDVMPNFIWEVKRNKMRGNFPDDYESAKYNGKLQFEKAKDIYQGLDEIEYLNDTTIDYGLMYVDFSNVEIDETFIPESKKSEKNKPRTSPACMGVSFFKGTVDGRGISDSLANFATTLCRTRKSVEQFKSLFRAKEDFKKMNHKYEAQGIKDILMETGERRVLGKRNINKLGLLSILDKSMETMKKQYSNGSLDNNAWTPQVLPLQFFILGNIAIIGIPAEVSVVSGRRFKKTIEEILIKRGVSKVIIAPFANCYSGYITTYEEYQHQLYEGGHTVFGEWTQAAYSTKLKYMANEMLKSEPERDFDLETQPEDFSEIDIANRSFHLNGNKKL